MTNILSEHRRIWQSKRVLRAVYEDCYRRMAAACGPGRTLEIGGGTGNMKAFLSDIVSIDIQFATWLDVMADAHRLPFADASFRNVVMFDVLHHLERPRLFLGELARVLVPGGRLVVVEPAISPLSYVFYAYFHPEPVRLDEDPLVEGEPSGRRDPYDSNQAIPTLLFGRDRERLERLVPALTVRARYLFSLFAYPLSGGFRRWSLLPARCVGPVLRLEDWLLPWLGWLMAFRMVGIIERKS